MDIALTPEHQQEATTERVKRANEKIQAILEEEKVSFHVEMKPLIGLIPNDQAPQQ